MFVRGNLEKAIRKLKARNSYLEQKCSALGEQNRYMKKQLDELYETLGRHDAAH